MTTQRTDEALDEELILAWVKLTGALKNTRITQGMIYNEAIVMMLAYNKYREDGEGVISFREIVEQTGMLKSLVNRTIDALVKKEFLIRSDGADKRTTFVRPNGEKLSASLEVHSRSLALAREIARIIGEEDARAFVRISEKVTAADPLSEQPTQSKGE